MSAEELRKTILATLAKIRDGAAQMVEGIDELLKQHDEGVAGFQPKQEQPFSITQADVEKLPRTPYSQTDPSRMWAFATPRANDDEALKQLRDRIRTYVESKGKKCFVGKYHLSLSEPTPDGTVFLHITESEREKSP